MGRTGTFASEAKSTTVKVPYEQPNRHHAREFFDLVYRTGGRSHLEIDEEKNQV